jgi:hypothetical protein
MEKYPNGGVSVSVHQPTKSLAWLEDNYDLQILVDIRNSGIFSGPVPMLLFPETSALVIFGPHREDKMGKLAQRLANKSNFPVISRPAAEDPLFRYFSTALIVIRFEFKFSRLRSLLGMDKTESFDKVLPVEPVVVMNGRVGDDTPRAVSRRGNGVTGGQAMSGTSSVNRTTHIPRIEGAASRAPQTTDVTHDPQTSAANRNSIPIDGSTAGGADTNHYGEVDAGDGDDPDGDGADGVSDSDKWNDWVSPRHTTKLSVDIKTSPSTTVALEITSQTQVSVHLIQSYFWLIIVILYYSLKLILMEAHRGFLTKNRQNDLCQGRRPRSTQN